MDVDEIIEKIRSAGSALASRGAAVALLLLVVAWGLWSCFFTIGADSVAIVLRFGEPVRELGPGLHLKFPFGIEEAVTVPVERQQKVEFGYRTTQAGVESQVQREGYRDESLMLTGDLNVVDVQWAVQYRIADPKKYLFKVRNPRETFRYTSQAVMRAIVGDRTVNEVLTVGRAEVATSVKKRLQQLCDDYDIGLRVEQVNMQDITPPEPVKPSFDEVNEAQQQRSQVINEAKAEYNKAIPAARGEAKRRLQGAEGYAIRRVNEARGDTARFNSIYAEYKLAPDVTRRRLYIETMSEVLPKIERKIIVGENATNVVGLLPLGDGPVTDFSGGAR